MLFKQIQRTGLGAQALNPMSLDPEKPTLEALQLKHFQYASPDQVLDLVPRQGVH